MDQGFRKFRWSDILLHYTNLNNSGDSASDSQEIDEDTTALLNFCNTMANTSFAVITLEPEQASLLRATWEASLSFFAEPLEKKSALTLLFNETPTARGLCGWNRVNDAKELFRFRRHKSSFQKSNSTWWAESLKTDTEFNKLPESLQKLKPLAYQVFDMLEGIVFRSMLQISDCGVLKIFLN